MARIVLVLVSFFAMTCNARAWGDEGHKIVCEIAMRLAVPSTRAEIRRLIKTNSEFDFFSNSCMRALLEKSPTHLDKTEWFDRLIDEYNSLNNIRNTYAHGLWYRLPNCQRGAGFFFRMRITSAKVSSLVEGSPFSFSICRTARTI